MDYKTFESQYKESLFSSISIYIRFQPDYIACYGIIKKPDDKTDYKYEVFIDYENVTLIELSKFKNHDAIHIEGISSRGNTSIYFPNITDVSEIKSLIAEAASEKKIRIKELQVKKSEREQEERERLQKQYLERQKRTEQRQIFCNEQIKIPCEKYPFYVFEETGQFITFLYIDEAKNLIIKSVDKIEMECVFSTLEYKYIHYYEKAGTIHYVPEINLSYTGSRTFGGSFVPSKISLSPAIVGGLLSGPMGMAVGAMIGYKPAQYTPPEITPSKLDVHSQTQRIDDRSVIINYYSEKTRQYMDAEFPHDMFNFLQTYLKEKKYDIVLALEKQEYTNPAPQPRSETLITNSKLTLTEFEEAVQKLKIMRDNNLISDEELNEKKNELLKNI